MKWKRGSLKTSNAVIAFQALCVEENWNAEEERKPKTVVSKAKNRDNVQKRLKTAKPSVRDENRETVVCHAENRKTVVFQAENRKTVPKKAENRKPSAPTTPTYIVDV